MTEVQTVEEEPPLAPRVRVRELASYEEVRPYWEQVNRTYKGGELVLDWTARRIIWERFYRPRGYELKIVVAFEDECCTGIFPFLKPPLVTDGPQSWDLCDDMLIAQEYFCPPDRLGLYSRYLPPHLADDLSSFYRPATLDGFTTGLGTVIDLKESQDEYLSSLPRQYRRSLKHTVRGNADLLVEPDSGIRRDQIQELVRLHLEHWYTRIGPFDPVRRRYTYDKIHTDLQLMARAEEMGILIALYFFVGAELVAANFSVRRERDRVDDYICLRNGLPPHARRSLGTFAILKNMDHCRGLGIRYYDLSSSQADYKNKFVNTGMRFHRLAYPESKEAGRPRRPARSAKTRPPVLVGGS
jgi:hypothetical protein